MSATLGTNGPAFMGTFTTQGNPIYQPAAMTPTQPSATHGVTPRTDECLNGNAHGNAIEYLARTLETELAEARQISAKYEDRYFEATADLARLRAEVERLQALSDNAASAMQWAKDEFAAMKARADRAEAEALAQATILGRSAEREADLLGKLSRAEHALAAARKDSERLDWLERNVQEVGFERMNERVLGGCSFDRDAIDAAMKGTP